MSIAKTSFVTSSSEAAKALNLLLEPTDPKVKTVARDLGVSSAGARRRVLGLAEQRRLKAMSRAKKLDRLRVTTISHRVRIVRASVCSAGLWGQQAVGFSPKRRKWYRTLCAKHIGRQKLGSLDITFLLMAYEAPVRRSAPYLVTSTHKGRGSCISQMAGL